MAVPAYGKRFMAWLGLAAMLLLACAPTVSRFLAATHPAARTLTLSFCSEADSPGQAPAAIRISLDDHHDTSGKNSNSHLLDDCGYCSLMMHSAALPSMPPALPSVLLLVLLALVLPPLRRYTPIGAFPSGQPRAPPRFS